MLRFLPSEQLFRFPNLAQTMFQDRTRQFRDRLRWSVQVDAQGRERDQYDLLNPLYIIWENPEGQHGGSMRLMPTTGRVMVNETFGHLLPDGPIRDAGIWECTRFCLAPGAGGTVASALMQAGGEVMRAHDVHQFIGVFEAAMLRVYSRLGAKPHVLATSGTGRSAVGVGLWSYDETARNALEMRSGISSELMSTWFHQSQAEHRKGIAAR